MIAIVPIVVLIVGLLMWALCSRPAPEPSPSRGMFADIGRICFIVGLFWSVGVYSYVTIGDGPAPQRAPVLGPR